MEQQTQLVGGSGQSNNVAVVKSSASGGTEPISDTCLATVPCSNSNQPDLLTEQESWDLSERFAYMFTCVVGLLSRVLHVESLKLYLESLVHPIQRQPYIDSRLYCSCNSTEEVLKCL